MEVPHFYPEVAVLESKAQWSGTEDKKMRITAFFDVTI
jgi:hypothetical protein